MTWYDSYKESLVLFDGFWCRYDEFDIRAEYHSLALRGSINVTRLISIEEDQTTLAVF